MTANARVAVVAGTANVLPRECHQNNQQIQGAANGMAVVTLTASFSGCIGFGTSGSNGSVLR